MRKRSVKLEDGRLAPADGGGILKKGDELYIDGKKVGVVWAVTPTNADVIIRREQSATTHIQLPVAPEIASNIRFLIDRGLPIVR